MAPLPTFQSRAHRTEHAIVDPGLPQLAQALDAPYMREIFERYGTRWRWNLSPILRCSVTDTRYKPGRSCWITYSLDVPGEPPGIVAGRLDAVAATATPRLPSRPGVGTCSPELSMWVWRFPEDPVLVSLQEAVSERVVRPIVDGLRSPGECRSPVTVRVLKYEPARQCSFLVADASGARLPAPRLVGKVSSGSKGATAFAVTEQLLIREEERTQRFRVTASIAYDPGLGVLWRRWSPGQPFVPHAHQNGLEQTCARVAAGLADLDRSGIRAPVSHAVTAMDVKLADRVALIAAFRGQPDPLLDQVSERLRRADLATPAPQIAIHGDFSHSQILFEGDTPVFLDFDAASWGNPLYDVGLFIAALHGLGVRGTFSRREVDQAVQTFWQAYRGCVSWAWSDERLRTIVAWALVCRGAFKAMRNLSHDSSARVERLLRLANAYLN